ncbi:MAG TPA: DUF695 domain-containing protein [Verrucomicrobiae bacterium]|nr:DUF695 domain-containing protein [Verrucomicrobiae bacterium]
MTEWLSYSAAIDGAPGVVDIDVDLADPEVQEQYPVAIELSVRGFEADSSGLPTDRADDVLYALEEAIETALGNDGVLALTLAASGSYRFVSYATEAAFEQAVRDTAVKAGLEPSSSSAGDPQWSRYAAWALSGEALEQARDREQLEELESVSNGLGNALEIEFDYEFSDERSAQAALDALGAAGAAGEADFGEQAIVHVRRALAPTPEAIGGERARLNAVVARYGGAYLGWGCDPE